MSDHTLIDPDNDATWPAEVRSMVAAAADEIGEDEQWSPETECDLRAALGEAGVVVY